MRKMLMACVGALAVAVPAQAGDGGGAGRELKISGTVVRASTSAVSVENAVGDAVVTCAVPERLADTAVGFKVGDRVRMLCVRYRGRRAQLVKLQRLEQRGAKPERPDERAAPVGERQGADGAEARVAGTITALSRASVTVQGEAGSLTCSVPAERAEKVATRFAAGDRVKMTCRGSELASLEKPD